jgi:hypothetical protein
LAYPCGSWDQVNCTTQGWSTLSGGIPTQIFHTLDTATKYTGCGLNYTIARVYGVTGLAAGTCALLIRDDTITPVSTMWLIGQGTQSCGTCAVTLVSEPKELAFVKEAWWRTIPSTAMPRMKVGMGMTPHCMEQ